MHYLILLVLNFLDLEYLLDVILVNLCQNCVRLRVLLGLQIAQGHLVFLVYQQKVVIALDMSQLDIFSYLLKIQTYQLAPRLSKLEVLHFHSIYQPNLLYIYNLNYIKLSQFITFQYTLKFKITFYTYIEQNYVIVRTRKFKIKEAKYKIIQDRNNKMFITTPKHRSLHKSSSNLQKSKINQTFMNNDVKKSSATLKRSSIYRLKDQKDEQITHKIQPSTPVPKKNNEVQDNSFSNLSNNFIFSDLKNKQNYRHKDSISKLSGQSFRLCSTANITPNNRTVLQTKWEKTLQLYTMRNQLSKKYQFPSVNQLRKKYPILPGGDFYKILIKNRLFQRQWKINFPETISLDNDGNIVMIYTQMSTGVLRKKLIQKQGKQQDRYREQILKFKEEFLRDVQKHNKMRLLRDVKIQQNPNAPLSIMKYTEDNSYQFQTQVQSYRNFIQKKLKPARDSIMQRYVYSSDLRAMVFRLYFTKHINGHSYSGPEYHGVRFQNLKPIFKDSGSTSFPQTHKLTSTITLSDKRPDTIYFSKINNPIALQRFILIAKQLRKMLQFTEKVVIQKLYVDFIVDVFDKPWVINLKYCQVNPHSMVPSLNKQDHISDVSSCRLCGVVEKRENLKNLVSVRMLCQFTSHLKKRTKHQELHKIDFIQNININSKENKSSAVCKICYKVIIHELQLIKMQKKLAQICNIIPQNNNEYFQAEPFNSKGVNSLGQYKQWRLMLYFQDIKNMSQNSNSNQYTMGYNNIFSSSGCHSNKSSPQYIVKYQLCPKISQSFGCSRQSENNLKINQIKLHYFYSQTTNIDDFINSTEVVVSLYELELIQQEARYQGKQFFGNGDKADQRSMQSSKRQSQKIDKSNYNQKLIASGSTHILSSFNLYKSSSFSLKALMQNGQRQTATVLLFFQNKKYCQLTLKVGLVYDGSYNVANIPTKGQNNTELSNFIKWNQVWFSKSLWNSNPLPKEWMEIFGSKYNYNNINYSLTKNKDQENDQKILKKILESNFEDYSQC